MNGEPVKGTHFWFLVAGSVPMIASQMPVRSRSMVYAIYIDMVFGGKTRVEEYD